jgi:hypothetical protein
MSTTDFPLTSDATQVANRPTAHAPSIDGQPLLTPTPPSDADAAARADREARRLRNKKLLGRQTVEEMRDMLV